MTITEVGCMGVKPGLDIMDQSTWEGQILINTWKTVIEKPGGPYRVYWGLEMDDASKVWAFFDWDSVEQHQRFARTHGAEAVKDIPKICTHGEFTKHITMIPSSDILRSPLTEVVLAYFPAEVTPAERDETAMNLEVILTKTFGDRPGVKQLAHGWGLQNDFPVRGIDGQSGSVLAGFIGWSNPDVQIKFHQTNDYHDGIQLVKNMKGIISFYTFRMCCQNLERY